MFHKNSAQGSFLKYEEYHPGQTSHYLGYEVALDGNLNISALEQALQQITQRHELLRSSIMKNGDQYTFIPTENAPESHKLSIIDASQHGPNENSLHELLSDHPDFFNKPFDLKKGPLWRTTLVKTGKNKYRLAFLFHPLIADNKSVTIFLDDLRSFYNNQVNGHDYRLPTPKSADTDIQNDKSEEQKTFWHKKLADLEITRLHTPKSFTGAMRFNGKHKPFSLNAELIAKLKSQFPSQQIDKIILAALYTLLHRYTGANDITLGTTIDNRPATNTELNACATWLSLRLKLDNNANFKDVIKHTHSAQTEAAQHLMPIEDIYQSALSDQQRSTLRTTAPFDVLLNFNRHIPKLNLQGLNASPVQQIDLGHNSSALFQMNLNQQSDASCTGFLNYNTDLFDDKSVEKLLIHFTNLLESAAQHPDIPLHDLSMLTPDDINRVQQFNQTAAKPFYQGETTEAFSSIAAEFASQEALVFHHPDGKAERMTYQQLDEYSNQIANYLRNQCNLKKGDHVAISITRSTNLPAFMLGALKAGLVMVPLDTSPGPLLEHKLKQANAKAFITDQHSNKIFKDQNAPVINIDEAQTLSALKSNDTHFRSESLSPDDPAYIMFSSGTSSGIPKASLMNHGGLTNLLNALHEQHYKPGLKVLCTALPTFDAFLFDFLAAWSTGGSVHLSNDDERYSPQAVERIIRSEKINFAVFLPNLMSILPPDLPLEYVISMGAAPSEGTFDKWLASHPQRKIFNGLGHTETGICLSLQEFQPGADPDLVGNPIPNMQMYILDPINHTLCPPGVPGEIFVAGPGLAQKYIGSPELTSSKFVTMKYDQQLLKFVPCEANDAEAVKMYASGDYGCFEDTPDGKLSIKSIGRTDRRLKIYGVSIDLDGVESIISGNQKQIEGVVVIPKPDLTGLIAYVVRTNDFRRLAADEARIELRRYLQSTLLHPVARPKHIMFVTDIPKTANGKVDFRLLPLPPEREMIQTQPSQDLEHVLSNLWRKVLGCDDLDDIPPDSTFEELGGNSIALAALEIRINSELALTTRIGVGQHMLSKQMTLNSLTNAIRPFLHIKPNTLIPPINTTPISAFYGARQVLFPKKSYMPSMKINDAQISSNKPTSTYAAKNN